MFLRMQAYERPTDLGEALRLLTRPGYRPLAGGTAAVGPVDVETAGLVDLSGLDLQYSRMEHDGLVLGAMTPLGDLLRLPELLLIGGGVLGKAVERTGPPTLLSRATLGGSLAGHPGQAPDLVTTLLALDAQVTVAWLENDRVVQDTTTVDRLDLQPGSLIEAVRIPVKPVLTGYERVARTPRDLPAVAVVAAMQQDGHFVQNVRIAAWGVAQKPLRLTAAEEELEDTAPIEAVIQRAAEAAAAAAEAAPSDLRGSSEYRRHLAGVLTRRAVEAAASRMGRM
ncbi:MAG TPA: FAD binding domain-containing protein [Symbiobacteriaceae bacterium]|nr:FAD binding domain-containing protein [Symbiobacteriaceae bacterium]